MVPDLASTASAAGVAADAAPAPRSLSRRGAVFLEMIKFQHTVFALPFAATGLILATNRSHPPHIWPGWWIAAWVLACCVFARTAAMSFNRWADAALDARNPRTATRAIPAGVLTRRFALAASLVSAAGFIAAAGMLNRLTLLLSPIALAVLFGYSYCKRFTAAAHAVLGLALGIAPIGAWVAVRGEVWSATPLLLGLGVLLWTTGFDIIYACQDIDVDRRDGLYSIPARLGVGPALWISRAAHLFALAALAAAGYSAQLHAVYFVGVAAVAVLLFTEHLIVRGGDLRRIDLAFFTVNSWVGVVMFAFTLADLILLGAKGK